MLVSGARVLQFDPVPDEPLQRLARRVLMSAVAVVGVAVVFTALLVVGPPGGREA
jgi:hypothetical protein